MKQKNKIYHPNLIGRLSKRRPLLFYDFLGMTVSGLCMIHCAVTPIILLMLPAISDSDFLHPFFAVAAFFSSIFLYLNHRHHHDKVTWMLLASGNILLMFSSFILHDELHLAADIIINSTASFLLIFVHYKNYLNCKREA